MSLTAWSNPESQCLVKENARVPSCHSCLIRSLFHRRSWIRSRNLRPTSSGSAVERRNAIGSIAFSSVRQCRQSSRGYRCGTIRAVNNILAVRDASVGHIGRNWLCPLETRKDIHGHLALCVRNARGTRDSIWSRVDEGGWSEITTTPR